MEVTIDRQLCNDCGICMDECPVNVFHFDPTGKVISAYPQDCFSTCPQRSHCCADLCPEKAIQLSGASDRSVLKWSPFGQR